MQSVDWPFVLCCEESRRGLPLEEIEAALPLSASASDLLRRRDPAAGDLPPPPSRPFRSFLNPLPPLLAARARPAEKVSEGADLLLGIGCSSLNLG